MSLLKANYEKKLLLLCTFIPIFATPLASISMKIDIEAKTEDINKTLEKDQI